MMGELCRHLAGERIAVLTAAGDTAGASLVGGVRTYRVPGCMPPKGLVAHLRLAGWLAWALLRERPRMLLFATLEESWLAYWTHRLLRLPHVFFAHGNEVLATARSTWPKARHALLEAAAVIAVSQYTRNLLVEMGVRPERIVIIHPGCDLQHFRRHDVGPADIARLSGGRPHRHRLLTVGNLVPRKGHDMVLRALAAMQATHPDVLYLIAGDGPNRAALEQLAAELGVTRQVVFLGTVEADMLPLLYSAADVFVMPSRARPEADDVEGFGIVFIEAAACGCPSIAGRAGGSPDAVLDGLTGMLVDPQDPRALAAALGRLLAEPALRQALGSAGQSRAERDFGWSSVTEKVAAVMVSAAALQRP